MRYVIAIASVLLVIGGLVFVKFSQISMLINMGKEMEKAGPPPEAVGAHLAEKQTWERTMSSVGTITSVKGVDISNDAPGVVSKISFESGAMVKAGDVLVELDASVERAQVVSAEVQRQLADKNVKRSRALVTGGVGTQQQLDADESALRAASAQLEVLYAEIKRKVVRAPFAGRLGMRSVNVGQYLNPGTPLTVLEAIESVYVDFSLPQQERVTVGMAVRIAIADAGGLTAEGVIDAIDARVDPVSRTMKLRAKVPNKDDKLRPGMFAQVTIVLPESPPVVTVPATAVIHASYGDSVFIVEDAEGGADKGKVARQQFVRVGESRGDFVAIAEGVKEGQEVVTAGAFKLHNGAPVKIDNTIENKPSVDPHPENH